MRLCTFFRGDDRLGWIALMPLLAALSCSSGSSTDPDPDPDPVPAIALALSPTSATVGAGASTQTTATVTRSGGYTGSVSFVVTGAPSGVTATVENIQTSGTTTTATVNVAVGAAAAVGTHDLQVRAQGTGVAESARVFQLTVAVTALSIAVSPAGTVAMQQGSVNSTRTISLDRTNFAGNVTLSAENLPTGLTATFAPNPTTGNSATLTLTAAAGMTTGSHTIGIRAVGAPPSSLVATTSLSVTVSTAAWNNNWLYRRQITVTATAAAVPAGYSVSLPIDHVPIVSAGKSLASGNDVRVVYWNGTAWIELDRVLDAGVSWNSGLTRIWFRTQAPIAANGSDNNYYLHYGNSAAPLPPTNATNVFLFADDFEAGTLARWSQMPASTWAIDAARAHAGTRSVRHPAEPTSPKYLLANPTLDIDNVYFESWWYTNSSTSYDIGQVLRQAGTTEFTNNAYFTNLFRSGLNGAFGWSISKEIDGFFAELVGAAGTPAPDAWVRVGTAMFGGTFRVFINGVQVSSAPGLTELTRGNVGFQKYVVPPGTSWWIDDVVARRYVNPEPVAAGGAEQTGPFVVRVVSR